MFLNNRTHLVAVQILFIIKVISQYWCSWYFLFFVFGKMDKSEKIEICDRCGNNSIHLKDKNEHSSNYYSCCHCGKSIQSKNSLNCHEKILRKHLRTIHEGYL